MAALFALILAAQAAVPPVQDNGAGEDIVVTARADGRGLRLDEGQSAAQVVVTRDRLASTASGRLEDALADIAGLQSFRRADSRSANPTAQGITLRGLGGNAASRALLILDGVPQTDPFGGWVAFPAYALDRLGAARVQRGGGSGLWGSGAIAGVIALESATPDQLGLFSGAVLGGERDAIEARMTATLKRPGGFATFSLAHAQGNGFAPIVAADRGAVDRAAPYRQWSGAARGVIAIGPDIEVQATLQAFDDRRERGLDFTDIASQGADASLRLVGNGRWRFSTLVYLQTRDFASRFASVNDARTVVTPTLDQFGTPATGLGGRVEIMPPVGGGITLALGADIRAIGGRTQELFTYVAGQPTRRRDAGGNTQTLGGFAALGVDMGALRLEADGRIDSWTITSGFLTERPLAPGAALTDVRHAERRGTEATGRLGLAWQAAGPVTLRAAGYRAWRLPTPNELYRPFRAGADATAANPLLAPERLVGAEAGIDLALGRRLRLSATAFANRLDNAVANVTISRGPGTFPGVGFVSAAGFYRRRDNLDAIETTGLEVDAAATFGALSITGSYALSDARVQASGAAAALDGLRPAQVPRHAASLTAAWERGRTRLSATLRYQADAFEDDQNARVLPGATTVDLTAAMPITRHITLRASAENLFDALVQTGFSGTARERARPRQLWAGIGLAF